MDVSEPPIFSICSFVLEMHDGATGEAARGAEAARSMSAATSSGCEIITRWEATWPRPSPLIAALGNDGVQGARNVLVQGTEDEPGGIVRQAGAPDDSLRAALVTGLGRGHLRGVSLRHVGGRLKPTIGWVGCRGPRRHRAAAAAPQASRQACQPTAAVSITSPPQECPRRMTACSWRAWQRTRVIAPQASATDSPGKSCSCTVPSPGHRAGMA